MSKIRFILVIVFIILLLSLTLIPCFADVLDTPDDYAIFPFLYDFLPEWDMDNIASNQLAYILDGNDLLFSRTDFYTFPIYGGDEGEYFTILPDWLSPDMGIVLSNTVWHESIDAYFYLYCDQYEYSEYHDVTIDYYIDLVYDQDDRFTDGIIEIYVNDSIDGSLVCYMQYTIEPVVRSDRLVLHVYIDNLVITPDELDGRPWNFDYYVALCPKRNGISVATNLIVPIVGNEYLEYLRCSPRSFYGGFMGYANEYAQDYYELGFANGKNVGESNVYLDGIFGDFFNGVTDAINNFTLFVYDNTAVTLGTVFAAGIGIALFIWILKIFAGG